VLLRGFRGSLRDSAVDFLKFFCRKLFYRSGLPNMMDRSAIGARVLPFWKLIERAGKRDAQRQETSAELDIA
jgi:hypothetical protein